MSRPTDRDRYQPIVDWSDRETQTNFRGYVLVFVPEHPRSFCKGWTYEHKLVMEAKLGRLLRRRETVHHINEIKSDNREENLFVCGEREHIKAHGAAIVV